MKSFIECQSDEVYSKIKESTIETINNYILHGWEPGSFVYAVLSNNLIESFGCADTENARSLKEICCYVYNEIPSAAWGSAEKVAAYLKTKL